MSRPSSARRNGSWATLGVFAFGIPLGFALIEAIANGPWPELVHYTTHPVERVEFIMFSCGIVTLLLKGVGFIRERHGLGRSWLPAWSGNPQPVAEAEGLLKQVRERPGHDSLVGRRVSAILDFVASRGAANELDDQMRCLADNDALAQDNSYGLLRFITWAIPILGFLGTVLGITGAIAGVNPEALDLSGVTGGLATAFDSTAAALSLTMVLMFCTYLMERLEQTILSAVDAYVDTELAHRFERQGPESGEYLGALRQNTQVLLQATEQLVERQAGVWARTIEKADKQWNDHGQKQQIQLTSALNSALEKTLDKHQRRLEQVEQGLLARSQTLIEGITTLATTLRDTAVTQQRSLEKIADKLASQTHTLEKIQEGEAQLARLQESLQNNLAAITAAGTFDNAVQSLTAAIHLLTTRVVPAAPLRNVQKPAA